MYDNSMQTWGPALVKQRPDLTMDMIDKFLTRMYVTNADFVFSVPRDVVAELPGAGADHAGRDPVAPLRARHRVGDAGAEGRADLLPVEGHEGEDPARGAARAHVPQGEPAGLIPMPASKYVRPTVWVPPTVSAVLQPQPPLAPSIPPAHVVDLMTEAGSAAFGAVWRVKEAKLVECPALTNSLPEFKTTYDIEPHAELLRLRRLGLGRDSARRSRRQARRRPGVVHLVPRDPDDPRERRGLRHRRRQGGVPRQRRRLRGSLDQRRDAAHPRPAEPGGDPGLQHAQPRRAGRRRRVPGDRFEIAVFAINGPISAAPGNFLFVREAKVEFFR